MKYHVGQKFTSELGNVREIVEIRKGTKATYIVYDLIYQDDGRKATFTFTQSSFTRMIREEGWTPVEENSGF
jgi:hypothetical protein